MGGRHGCFDPGHDCRPDEREPVYTIGVAAEIVRMHPRTLRMYEAEGVMVPARRSGRRFYSSRDLQWVRCVRTLLHREGLNLRGVRSLLASANCWELLECPSRRRESCPAYGKVFVPCWALVGHDGEKCYNCHVYQQARDELCRRAKLAS